MGEIVRNQKILDFYKRNPSLNFEQINLIIIDLLDQLQNGEHSWAGQQVQNSELSWAELAQLTQLEPKHELRPSSFHL